MYKRCNVNGGLLLLCEYLSCRSFAYSFTPEWNNGDRLRYAKDEKDHESPMADITSLLRAQRRLSAHTGKRLQVRPCKDDLWVYDRFSSRGSWHGKGQGDETSQAWKGATGASPTINQDETLAGASQDRIRAARWSSLRLHCHSKTRPHHLSFHVGRGADTPAEPELQTRNAERLTDAESRNMNRFSTRGRRHAGRRRRAIDFVPINRFVYEIAKPKCSGA